MAELVRKRRNAQTPEIRRSSKPESNLSGYFLELFKAGIYPGIISQALVG